MIKKIVRHIGLLVVLLSGLFAGGGVFLSCDQGTPSDNADYQVLFIQSYREDNVWKDDLNQGIAGSFRKHRMKATVRTFYLNSEAFTDEEATDMLKDLLDESVTPDIIFVSGDQSLKALMSTKHSLIYSMPIVFSGVSYFNPEIIKGHSNVTGFTRTPDYGRCIELMRMIYPEMNRFYFDIDNTELGQKALAEFERQMAMLSLPVTYTVTNMDTSEARSFLMRSNTSDVQVHIMPVWSSFYSGRVRNTSSAFFAPNNEGIGTGYLGGYFILPYDQAYEAAELGIKILKGEEVTDHPVLQTLKKQYIFDWEQMKKLDVSIRQIPSESLLVNMSFYDRYYKHLIGVGIVLALLVIGLCILFYTLYRKANRQKSKTQWELHGHRNKLKIVMSSIREGVISIDRNMNVFAINPSATHWLKLKNSESYYLGRNILSLIDVSVGGVNNQLETLISRVLNDGETFVFDDTFQMKSLLNESSFLVSGSISAIYENGRLYGAVIILNDATEEYAQQEFLSLTLGIGGFSSWRFDRKNERIVFDSAFFKRFDNVKNDGDNGIPISEFRKMIHEEDTGNWDTVNSRLISGEYDKYILSLRININGKGFQWWEIRFTCLRSIDEHEVPLIFGLSSNVDKSFQSLEALEQARKKAQMSDKLKSAFLANMSHEIRTPLNAIVGFANVLTTGEGLEPEERQLFIETIRNNCNLLLGLISDVLDLAQIESGSMNYNDAICDINQFIGEIIVTQRVIIPDHLELIGDIPEETCFLSVDKLRMNQVITNLINNAVKFTQKGHVKVGYTNESDGFLHFFVEDTGRGIPEKDLNNIFERFYKKDDFVQGAGLGLSISKMIVDHYGGTISVQSIEGKGSRFTASIPYTEVDDYGNSNTPNKKRINKNNINKLFNMNTVSNDNQLSNGRVTLLIAEDEESNYLLLKTVLQKYCNLIRAKTRIEALDQFKAHPNVDLIMLDIKMPEMTGIEALKEIRKISTEIPVIMQSAYVFDTDMEAARQAGASDFITKPINLKVLKATLSKFCPRLQF